MLNKEMEVIIDSTNDGMMAIDKDGCVTLFNRAAELITGFKKEEVAGKHVSVFFPETQLPEIMAKGKAELNQSQKIRNSEITISRIPIHAENGKISGAVAVFRDVSDLMNLSDQIDQLKEMQSLLEGILHSTQDAISVCDEKGIHVLINPAYTRLTGLSEKDIIGKPVTVDIADGQSVHLQALKKRKPVSNARLKVGKHQKEIIASAAPIIVDGELRGSVGILQDLTEMKKLSRELMLARQIIRKLEAKYTIDDIIARDPQMTNCLEKARQAAETPATILLRGESGTGKELFAHAIHNLSDRRYKQFVRVNCAAISESLLESELFGYEEGAFTGARKGGKSGLFQEAHNGTIFLDEIAEIPNSTQVKLLRVLQEGEILPVGSTRSVNVDVRVISATNVNLEKAVEEGRFREDLYYRLNVIPIQIPPLRERKKDIYPLVISLLNKYNQEYGRNAQDISPDALIHLQNYHWPGNVRELQNYIGRAMVNMKLQETILEEMHLPKFFDSDSPENASDLTVNKERFKNKMTLEEGMREAERQIIRDALKANSGNRTKTAEALNISIRSLYYKIQKLDIQ
ncbi:MAG: sigma-54-dependent transcriptional regulator [Tindallia sp. MSAO_Bac2]|nr:MAG: sigma-54-dependent transcriptional regulator [Tindallia sp. MSAO_Bac2]